MACSKPGGSVYGDVGGPRFGEEPRGVPGLPSHSETQNLYFFQYSRHQLLKLTSNLFLNWTQVPTQDPPWTGSLLQGV